MQQTGLRQTGCCGATSSRQLLSHSKLYDMPPVWVLAVVYHYMYGNTSKL